MTEHLLAASARFAAATSRRRFLRRAANATFAGFAALSAGRVLSPTQAFAYTKFCESSVGNGCPKGCGPSTCCNYGPRSNACNCGTGTTCKSGTTNCHGKAGTWNNTSCWTCVYRRCLPPGWVTFTTTCCDCATTGCGDDAGRCISYKTTSTVGAACGGAAPTEPPGTVIGVDTGDPSTSWGYYEPSYP